MRVTLLSHNWKADFIDATKHIRLTKPSAGYTRQIFLRYDGQLRRIDKHGNQLNDTINPLAPETRRELLAACRERWG